MSRRLKRPVLAAQPDVNPSSPSSIGRVASSGGRAAMACGPVAPVGFPRGGLDGCSIWMGRSEPRDANGLAAASWVMVARWPRAIDRYRSAIIRACVRMPGNVRFGLQARLARL